MPKRIVVGISGASGVIYGVRLLWILNELGYETHLIISKAGMLNLRIETDALAHHLLFEGTRCTGLRYEAKGEVREARAGREVIVKYSYLFDVLR